MKTDTKSGRLAKGVVVGALVGADDRTLPASPLPARLADLLRLERMDGRGLGLELLDRLDDLPRLVVDGLAAERVEHLYLTRTMGVAVGPSGRVNHQAHAMSTSWNGRRTQFKIPAPSWAPASGTL